MNLPSTKPRKPLRRLVEKDPEVRRKKRAKEIEKEKLWAFKEAEDEKKKVEVEERKKDEVDRVAADDLVVVQSTLAWLASFIVCFFFSSCLADGADIFCHSGILLPPLPPPKLALKVLIALRLRINHDDVSASLKSRLPNSHRTAIPLPT
jgi:hypothetical protein